MATLKEIAEKYSLPNEQLYTKVNASEFGNIKSTAEIESSKGLERVIGQEEFMPILLEAIKSVRPNDNIILIGSPGIGKSLAVKVAVEHFNINNTDRENYDRAVSYNFGEPDEPHALTLSAGIAMQLRKDLKTMVKSMQENFRNPGNEYKIEYIREQARRKAELIDEYNKKLAPLNAKITEGNSFETYGKDKVGTQYQFSAIRRGEKLKPGAMEIMYEFKNRLGEINSNPGNYIGEAIINKHLSGMKKKYEGIPDIEKMLDEFHADMAEHSEMFYKSDERNIEFSTRRDDDHFQEYQIKILVDNSLKPKGMQFTRVEDATYERLFGKVEWEALGHRGLMPHKRVKGGALLKYDVIVVDESRKLIKDPSHAGLDHDNIRDKLLTVLQEMEMRVGGGGGYNNVGRGVETEPFKINPKLILCANADVENRLMLDENAPLRRRFKRIIRMNDSMPNTLENRLKIARFVKDEIESYNSLPKQDNPIPHASPEAVARLIEYLCVPEGKKELSLQLDYFGVDIICRAGMIRNKKVKEGKSILIEADDIDDAYKFIAHEKGLKLEERIKNLGHDAFNISKEPEVGVINVLWVIDGGNFKIGGTTRLCAKATFRREPEGGLNITYIDDKAEMVGKMTKKSFGQIEMLIKSDDKIRFTLDADLGLTTSQYYSEMDGPSASMAMYTVCMSALADVPIFPYVFLTGDIEPIIGKPLAVGGIVEKITDGAWLTCKSKNAPFGVVAIPEHNIDDLQITNKELLKDIEDGKFKIVSYKTKEEAIEIATGITYDELTKKITNGYLEFHGVQIQSEDTVETGQPEKDPVLRIAEALEALVGKKEPSE